MVAGSIGPMMDLQSVVAESPWDGALVGPSFDPSQPEVVTVSVGQPAYLACRVRQLGDRKVSWIRKRDLHILTFGQLSYTNDARFSVIRSTNGDMWTLRVRSVQLRDEGLYECQVSSEPKISKSVRLKVVVSQAAIQGSPEMYIRTGSDIRLSCTVHEMPEPPTHFTWFKGDQIFSHQSHVSHVHRVALETSQEGMENHLSIRNAETFDSGNYTCIPAGAEPASIVVHVLYGEHPAAMQHGHGGKSRLQPPVMAYSLLPLTVIEVQRYLVSNSIDSR